jgi:two-component system, OmpR family, response regulator
MSLISRATSNRHARVNPNGATFLDRDSRWSHQQPATLERDRSDAETNGAGHILVVDDDPTMQRTIISYFEQHNVSTSAVSSQHELRRQLAVADPSLIILDIQLDKNKGFDRLKEIRSYSDVPIIVMIGNRCDEVDRVVGLELGADDCLTRQFGVRELLARVRAVLRRQEIGRAARFHDSERGGYRFNGWRLERRNRRLVDPGGTPIPLTKCEYALLLAFVQAPQRPLTREQLLHATRLHEDIFDRSVDVQVLRLRRKLEVNPGAHQVIKTERGVGYIFALPVEPF